MDEPLFNELLESVKQADQIMTDHAELRRIAKAATPGEWRVQTGCSWRRIGTDNGDGDVLRPCTHPHDGWPDIEAPVENLEYIAAASPKTILALLDEIDGIKAENEALKAEARKCFEDALEHARAADELEAERDQLRTEVEALRRFAAEAYQVLGALDAPENVLDNASDAANGVPLRHETLLPFFADDYEALRKDAVRYRWLRERDLETIRQGGVFAGMTPENIVLNQEDLDAEIDAALEGATQ